MSEDPTHRDGTSGTDRVGPEGAGPAADRREAPGGPAEGEREVELGAAETDTGGTTEDPHAAGRVPPERRGTVDDQPGDNTRIGSWTRRVPQVLTLALVWVLLWGSLKPVTIVGGLLVGLLVTVLFPLPLLAERLPFRPLRLLRLVGFLLGDLLVSGGRVSMETVLHGRRARSGIVGLPLCTASDRVVVTIVTGCALTPGSYVLHVDRRRGRWYVYALGLRGEDAVARLRRNMMNLQMRVIDAIGSEADVRRCRAAVADVAEGRDAGRPVR